LQVFGDIGANMYSVGINEAGQTTLSIGEEGGFKSTLTMSTEGVIQMIRLLEATLPEYKEEE
jgi:hypothetical protein